MRVSGSECRVFQSVFLFYVTAVAPYSYISAVAFYSQRMFFAVDEKVRHTSVLVQRRCENIQFPAVWQRRELYGLSVAPYRILLTVIPASHTERYAVSRYVVLNKLRGICIFSIGVSPITVRTHYVYVICHFHSDRRRRTALP